MTQTLKICQEKKRNKKTTKTKTFMIIPNYHEISKCNYEEYNILFTRTLNPNNNPDFEKRSSNFINGIKLSPEIIQKPK